MTKLLPITVTLVLTFISCVGVANEYLQPSPPQGAQTRQWLQLQKSGSAASVQPQTLSGPAAERIYDRYLDSFTHPIPEYFTEVDANPFNNVE